MRLLLPVSGTQLHDSPPGSRALGQREQHVASMFAQAGHLGLGSENHICAQIARRSPRALVVAALPRPAPWVPRRPVGGQERQPRQPERQTRRQHLTKSGEVGAFAMTVHDEQITGRAELHCPCGGGDTDAWQAGHQDRPHSAVSQPRVGQQRVHDGSGATEQQHVWLLCGNHPEQPGE